MKKGYFIATLGAAALAFSASTVAVSGAACCGDVDTSFVPYYGANDVVNASVRQNDGNVIIGGAFTSYNGTTKHRLARLTASGSLDTTFNASVDGLVLALALEPGTENLVAVGAFSYANGYYRVYGVAKFLPNGNYDTSFSSPVIDYYPYAVSFDGGILIGGAFNYVGGYYRRCIARLQSNGSVDTGFTGPSGMDTGVFTIRPGLDGLFIGGSFTYIDGYNRGRLARLNSTGRLDSTWPSGNASLANGTVYAIDHDQDNRILIGGAFTQVNGQSAYNVARLSRAGDAVAPAVDAPNGTVRVVKDVINSGYHFLIGGEFTTVGGETSRGFARFNCSMEMMCSVGNGFTGGTGGAPTSVNTISVANGFQPDRAFCGGNFTAYKDATFNRVAQLFITCVQ